MKGFPKVLNTKQDVVTCHALALAGELNGKETKQRIMDLLSDEKVWVFKVETATGYLPLANEKVMEETDMTTGAVKHICFEFQDNPNARFLQLGFQRKELQNLINQL